MWPAKKKVHPLVWVAIGIPAAMIALCIIGAIIGGPSDKSTPVVQGHSDVDHGSAKGNGCTGGVPTRVAVGTY